MTAWIMYALAVSALAGLAARAMEALLRLYRLPTRWAWAAALAVSCSAPFALSGRRAAPDLPAPTPALSAVAAEDAGWTAAPVTAPAAPTLRQRADGVLPALWAGASTLALAALAGAAALLHRRRRGWAEASIVGTRVLVSPAEGPAVVGFARPAIVVPRRALSWPEAMQAMVVRHEREHIRARDPLLVLAATAAAALAPWNLAAWWQLRRLRLAVEVDCDTRTLRGGGDLAAYGDLLLRVGAMGRRGHLATAAFAEPRSFLERRIRAMTAPTPRNRAALAAGCAAAALVVVGAAYALPAPDRPEALSLRTFAVLRPAPDTSSPLRTAAPEANGDTVFAMVDIDTAAAPPAGATATVQAFDARDTTRIFAISDVDVQPALANGEEVRRAMDASYPQLLRDAGVGGIVEVEMVVEADGVVRDPRVVRSDNDAFNEPALRAAARIRMRPARRGGRAVAVRLRLPLSFQPQRAAPNTPVPDAAGVYDVSAVDVRPTMVNRAQVARALEASYPPLLRDAGVGGTVTVEVVAQPDGSVRQARVSGSSDVRFNEAALRVASTFRMRPGSMDGRAVPVRFQLPVTFTPNGARPTAAPLAGTVYELAQVDDAPAIVNRAAVMRSMEAAYPPSLRGSERSDVVLVTMVVRADGSTQIAPPSARDPFAEAAYEVAREMRFRPARKDGRAVATRISVPVAFYSNRQTSGGMAGGAVGADALPTRSAGGTAARKRSADPTPELLGRAIDPGVPRVPEGLPAPGTPAARP